MQLKILGHHVHRMFPLSLMVLMSPMLRSCCQQVLWRFTCFKMKYDAGQSYLESVRSSAMISNSLYHKTFLNPVVVLPSLNDLDLGVIKSLLQSCFQRLICMEGS